MNILSHLFNSALFLYSKPFSAEWSDKLSFIIDNHESAKLDRYAISFTSNGEVLDVWIANKFYGYGYAWYLNNKQVSRSCMLRPSFSVINKLHDLENKLRRDEANKFLGSIGD